MDEKKLMAILDSVTFGALPGDRRHKRRYRIIPEPYPDYGKSLVTQGKGSPFFGGAMRGLGYGGIGALLGGLGGKLANQDKNTQIMLSVLGGLLGGGLGYYSGKRETESDNSKLLFLRRLGINNPGELAAATEYPTLARKLTDEGVQI
jgi:hypothetical protein